jgi:SAM-dependent methyltransferase
MTIRESGMPAQAYWETLFDVPLILDAFGFNTGSIGPVAELGCGYGTFTVPLAQRLSHAVHALDVDPAMVATTAARARAAVLLFNILHAEDPVALLCSVRDLVRPGGQIAVIHWRSDLPTPRGPSLAIRPTPAQILTWAAAAGGLTPPAATLDLPPWHYGLNFLRTP